MGFSCSDFDKNPFLHKTVGYLSLISLISSKRYSGRFENYLFFTAAKGCVKYFNTKECTPLYMYTSSMNQFTFMHKFFRTLHLLQFHQIRIMTRVNLKIMIKKALQHYLVNFRHIRRTNA